MDTVKSKSRAALWLTEQELAERLNLSIKVLQSNRLKGCGVPFAKFGSAVRYSLSDIEAFEQRAMRRSTSDDGRSEERE